MERKYKKVLEKYFEAPKPERKNGFLRQFEMSKIDMPHMLATQVRYISKWVWLFSSLFCATAFGMARYAEQKYLSVIFAIVPFLVMISVTESMRSYRYGMEELELSARFSLKSIVMARMVILGIGNMAVLVLTALFVGDNMYASVVYMIVPYFVTAGGGLYLVRNMRGTDGTFACFLLAVIVSLVEVIVPWKYQNIFTARYFPYWLVACAAALAFMMRESYRTIRMTEDLAWS